jgi:hypothetical protein
LPSGFPTKTLSSSPYALHAPPIFLLNFITPKILGEYRSLSYSLCSFLHALVTSSLLGTNILNTRLSITLTLRSSLNVSDQVSRPHKTGKIIVLHIYWCLSVKGKAIPLQAWRGLEGSSRMKLPDF